VTLITGILKFVRRERVLTAIIAVVVILPLLVFALITPVKTGTETVCKYKHLIDDGTYTKWVFRWNAGSYNVDVKESTCQKHKYLERLWAKEKAAKKKGDYKKAASILQTIKVTDPSFPGLNKEIADVGVLAGGSSPGSQPGGTPSNPPPAEDQPPGYSGDLNGLFPSSLAGYTQISSSSSGLNASRLYQSNVAVHPKVSLLTIQLDQAGSEAEAGEFINTQIKTYYAADQRTPQINGQTAFFGTDSQKLAVLAYKVGGVVVMLEMQSTGGAPKDLYGDLVELSKDVP